MRFSRFYPLLTMLVHIKNLMISRDAQALAGPVSFDVEAGGALVITGKNGSGKSTLLRIVAGLLPAQADQLVLPPRVTYIGHHNALHPMLSVGENLDVWCGLVGAGKKLTHAALLSAVELSIVPNLSISKLSAGQKRRLALVRLIIEESTLWLLDEPHSALDAQGVTLLETLIAQHRAQGGAVIMASHGGCVVPHAAGLHLGAAIP